MKKSVFYRLVRDKRQPFHELKNIEVFSGDESSVKKIAEALYEGKPEVLEFYEGFYRNGIEPWIALSDGKIVGVIWLYTGSYLAMWESYDAWLLQVAVEPAAKFVANVFVHPDYRGRGVFSMIAEQCFTAYPESEFYSCVDGTNTASIKSHKKIGFQPCGAAYYIRFLQRTRCLFVPQQGKWKPLKLPHGVAVDVSLIQK